MVKALKVEHDNLAKINDELRKGLIPYQSLIAAAENLDITKEENAHETIRDFLGLAIMKQLGLDEPPYVSMEGKEQQYAVYEVFVEEAAVPVSWGWEDDWPNLEIELMSGNILAFNRETVPSKLGAELEEMIAGWRAHYGNPNEVN